MVRRQGPCRMRRQMSQRRAPSGWSDIAERALQTPEGSTAALAVALLLGTTRPPTRDLGSPVRATRLGEVFATNTAALVLAVGILGYRARVEPELEARRQVAERAAVDRVTGHQQGRRAAGAGSPESPSHAS